MKCPKNCPLYLLMKIEEDVVKLYTKEFGKDEKERKNSMDSGLINKLVHWLHLIGNIKYKYGFETVVDNIHEVIRRIIDFYRDETRLELTMSDVKNE